LLIRWFIASFIHWLTDYSWIHSPIDALSRCFIDSLAHWFIDALIRFSLIHWFVGSLIHWLTDSWTHGLAGSLVDCFTDSLSHWFSASLPHWFIGSSAHYFTHSLIHSLVYCFHWFTGSLIHWLINLSSDLLIHCFVPSSIHWFTDWFVDSFSQLCMDSFMSFHWHLNNHLLIRWCISQLQHFFASASQKLFYRPSSSYSCFISSKLPPRRRPGTTWYVCLFVCLPVCLCLRQSVYRSEILKIFYTWFYSVYYLHTIYILSTHCCILKILHNIYSDLFIYIHCILQAEHAKRAWRTRSTS
jgi:hypothetical protein